MRAIIQSVSEWTPIDPKKRIEQIRNRDSRKGSPARFVLGDLASPLDLYVYLKARFGHPNGIQMALRNQSTDNLVHWHYTIAAGSAVLEIWQTNLTTEFWVEGIEPPTDSDWNDLISAIKCNFKTHGRKMSIVRKDLECWHLFINPYKRLRDVLDRSRDDLKSLKIDSINIPETPKTTDELRSFAENINKEQRRFDEALRLGVTIRMLTPVLGEAFINLVIFLLAKPDIKGDQRLYQDVIRREIDVRVKSLHLYCDGFEKPVDGESERFKAFHTLMNGRNDFLHGNVDPTKLKYDTVYFDYRTLPIFEKRASFGELALSHRLIHVEPERALADIETVIKFIEAVLECIEPKRRTVVEGIMNSTSPGWRPDKGTVGMLFPEVIIHSVPGPS